jgi:hypothetical protein
VPRVPEDVEGPGRELAPSLEPDGTDQADALRAAPPA